MSNTIRTFVLDLFCFDTHWLWLFLNFSSSVLDLFRFGIHSLWLLWAVFELFISLVHTIRLRLLTSTKKNRGSMSGTVPAVILFLWFILWPKTFELVNATLITVVKDTDYTSHAYFLWYFNHTWTGHFTFFFNFEFPLFTVLSSHKPQYYTHILDTSFLPPHFILTSQLNPHFILIF